MQILIASPSLDITSLIQRTLARFNYDWVCVNNGFDAFQKLITTKFDLVIMTYELPRMNAAEVIKRCASIDNFRHPPALVLTATDKERHIIECEHFSRTVVISRPFAIRRFVASVQQSLNQNIRVACLGGGTGLYTLLSGLKALPNISLSSIVSMSDDGGSTGRLRDMFGILPPGDVRRSLVALSTAPDLLNELMQFRFERGDGLEGHNLGNLLLAALNHMRGSMVEAVKALAEILNTQGDVIPVTETVNTLHAELENGEIVVGESHIGLFEEKRVHSRIKKLWQEPRALANPDALEAILNAKWILLGPGDLYTSVIANLVVDGIRDAIISSKAKKIYICNVMTKPGETEGYDGCDHVKEIIRYMGTDALNYVLASSTLYSSPALAQYAEQNQYPVQAPSRDQICEWTKADVVLADVASEDQLVRHDSIKLAATLKTILES